MIQFITGSIVTTFLIMFIGWIDVFVLKSPRFSVDDESKFARVKVYAIITAWEFMFMLSGIMIGKYVI